LFVISPRSKVWDETGPPLKFIDRAASELALASFTYLTSDFLLFDTILNVSIGTG
jgi:hypothetical protein